MQRRLLGVALTREVPESIAHCELTHLSRRSIDVARARQEHSEYERAIAELGYEVRRLAPAPSLPDSVFVEDTTVVLDEVAVLARPGAASRRAEVASMADALRHLKPVVAIREPGTLDGGDVLVLDREIVVGLSSRTNAAGAAQFAAAVESLGYDVRTIAVHECLHLKSGVTRVGPQRLLLNPRWVAAKQFPGWQVIECDPDERWAANALWLGEAVIHPAEYARTRTRLEQAGCRVVAVAAGELAKAEGGVTCCSVVVNATH